MSQEVIYNIDELKIKAQHKQKENKAFLNKLKKKKNIKIDDIVHQLHEEVFEYVDCLECANCCGNISPIIIDKDIERLAKNFRIKPSKFIEEHLYMDHENDYVYKKTPCPFLLDDNYCMVYENRPRACREYPHTDRKRFHQILNLSLKNTFVCPAVYIIVERLKEEINI